MDNDLTIKNEKNKGTMTKDTKNGITNDVHPHSIIGSHRSFSGGWKWLCLPAAALFSRKSEGSCNVKINVPLSLMVNDNARPKKKVAIKHKVGLLSIGIITMCMVINFSNIVTHTLPNINQDTLMNAMEVSPEAVGFLMNSLNIGEQ